MPSGQVLMCQVPLEPNYIFHCECEMRYQKSSTVVHNDMYKVLTNKWCIINMSLRVHLFFDLKVRDTSGYIASARMHVTVEKLENCLHRTCTVFP